MRYYETLYIVDPNLENKTLEKTMIDIGKELEKSKLKIINHRIWNKKRLAYQILNQKYGSYIILQFEGSDLSKLKEFDVWMKLNNTILRHMTVSLEEKPAIYVEDPTAKDQPESETSDDKTQNGDSSSSGDNNDINKDKKPQKEEEG